MALEESVRVEPLLQSFERRFLAARALRSFPWQSLEEKLRDSSEPQLLLDILQKTVKHPLCVEHPPSAKFTRCFLSELIKKHEAVHVEPLDELYQALAEVLTTEDSTQCHRSYLLPSGEPVTLSESTAIVSHGTTGLVTWNAALYLAEWAVENPAVFTDRTVLELGSGAGLTGLAICKACRPRAYIFSDCHSRVLEQLRGNILLNGLSIEPDATTLHQHPENTTLDLEKPTVAVAQLDWDLASASQLSAFQPDVIIAADVLYCPETVLSLIGVLQMLSGCHKDSEVLDAYVAFTMRNPDTCQLFTAGLGRAGVPWETVPRHNQKLFPYDEPSEMAILKLRLSTNTKYACPQPEYLLTPAHLYNSKAAEQEPDVRRRLEEEGGEQQAELKNYRTREGRKEASVVFCSLRFLPLGGAVYTAAKASAWGSPGGMEPR
ncbi:PREDICTED: protein FAM86A-like [Chrysochloris asiatica]|uniref:Protein FAM86A-like n=1 Tax=Chrysochloris asiatica TaxID=185453 RepID=A0A9B0U948_CHRAS|nr:PREDICTED: protein FAM86A-like [Chrysochloris asiatica]